MNEGEIVFVIGPNGAGKTTVFNLISGFLHPDEGSLVFLGKDISRTPPHATARLGIARTFQIVKPPPALTVLVIVMFGSFMQTPPSPTASDQPPQSLAILH